MEGENRMINFSQLISFIITVIKFKSLNDNDKLIVLIFIWQWIKCLREQLLSAHFLNEFIFKIFIGIINFLNSNNKGVISSDMVRFYLQWKAQVVFWKYFLLEERKKVDTKSAWEQSEHGVTLPWPPKELPSGRVSCSQTEQRVI